MFRTGLAGWLALVLSGLMAGGASAQSLTYQPLGTIPVPPSTVAGPTLTLKQAFEAAWARQPEARSLASRREAAMARRQVADSRTVEPIAIELSGQSRRLAGLPGSREIVLGLAIPLWLPGERARSGALADAELQATSSVTLAARWRTAAVLRSHFWLWYRAQMEHALAAERLGNARQLATDVAIRVKAGLLARADQHQADGAVASAQAAQAEAFSALAGAAAQLWAAIGGSPSPTLIDVRADGRADLEFKASSEPMPEPTAVVAPIDSGHPSVRELVDRVDFARRGFELARVQTRGNPHLTVAASREHGLAGESSQQSLIVGIRVPLGSDSRVRARLAGAQAELIELEELLSLERTRLAHEVQAVRVRVESAATQLESAQRRARLAQETRGFFEKSFRLGETDLPTRLRVELEATDAQRQAARAQIEQAAAISALRQALGLLPE